MEISESMKRWLRLAFVLWIGLMLYLAGSLYSFFTGIDSAQSVCNSYSNYQIASNSTYLMAFNPLTWTSFPNSIDMKCVALNKASGRPLPTQAS